MLELTYLGEETKYKVDFDIVSKNVVKIIGDLPDKTTGFILSREDEEDNWDYSAYTTVYSKDPGFILFSNDGSIKPLPVVKFITNYGGTIDGTTEQSASNYKDLTVPTVITEDGFEFVGWEPEVPTEGKIEEDVVFQAIIINKNVYFHVGNGGSLQGETQQAVDNYSELQIPSVIENENYEFVGWEPEVPTEGKIDITNTNFLAVFKSNIPSRVVTLETDLTDTQMGLVENYDFAITTAEEVTDLQLALVEVYDLLLGGM